MAWFDRLACSVTDQWAVRVYEHLFNYRLHDAYLEIVRFEGDDLSSFYLDALKDRLYSSAAGSERRRSAQSAIMHVLERFLTVIAPLLSFTAEEAWQLLPASLRGDRGSVFDLSVPSGKQADGDALSAWNDLKSWRSVVAASEGRRDYELQATLALPDALYERLKTRGEDVREALVVSALQLVKGAKKPEVRLEPAQGQKCARCWKYLPLGHDAEHPSLCEACSKIVTGA
jgi:isoleucyl-tRNA synthetase